MQNSDLLGDITRLLRTHEIPASRLCLELTETVMMSSADALIERMADIRFSGIQWALDDFGTGYSSLASMRAFPFDVIKLDRGFICELEHSQQARDIVKAVIAICDSLDVAILAEGVETHAQRDFLLQAGCFAVQGYLFGKPVPAGQCVFDVLHCKISCLDIFKQLQIVVLSGQSIGESDPDLGLYKYPDLLNLLSFQLLILF